MSLNETQYSSFQIKPQTKDKYGSSRCVFRNDAFSIDSVLHISAVVTLGGMNYFKFEVEIERFNQDNKVLSYEFATRSEALRAQRELCRAYTSTEEFAYEEKPLQGQDDLLRAGVAGD
jgi:hypothetical protein